MPMYTVFRPGYKKSLDGLRGLAALLVMAYHFTMYSPVRIYASFGWMGVDLFFVLSGFLITGILLDNEGKHKLYRTFILRRVMRIFPLYYLIVAASLACYLIGIDSFGTFFRQQFYFWTFTQNFSIAFGRFIYPCHNHLWTLAIENQFYLLWPLAVLFTSSRRLVVLCGLLILTGLVIRYAFPFNPFDYTFTFTRLDGLLVGAVIAVWIRRPAGIPARWAEILLFSMAPVLTAMIIYYGNAGYDNPGFMGIGYTLIALLFGGLLIRLFVPDRVGKSLNSVLEIRWLVWTGKLSYGLYAYHYIIFNLLNQHITARLLTLVGTTEASFLSIAACGLLTVITSYASYHLFEKKFLDLKRFVSYPHPEYTAGKM